MDPRPIYCHGEADEFAVGSFRHRADGTLFEPYIHETDEPHYASTGEGVYAVSVPGVVFMEPPPPTPESIRAQLSAAIDAHNKEFNAKRTLSETDLKTLIDSAPKREE